MSWFRLPQKQIPSQEFECKIVYLGNIGNDGRVGENETDEGRQKIEGLLSNKLTLGATKA